MAYKVLIVEDDPMVAMINEQYLEKNSKFTVAASLKNGNDAIDYLEKNPVDLILLDVFMPYMDGIETLKKIREKGISAEVIMVTAANDSFTIEQTMHLGVLDYLVKPFAFDRFQVSLEKFISHKMALKENTFLDQTSIDNIISKPAFLTIKKESVRLSEFAKGINKQTLLRIKEYLIKNPTWHTVEDLAEKLNLSMVTTRHYLNFLKEKSFITIDATHGLNGRPSMLYKKVDNPPKR